jgi:hypothetical protein
MAVIETLAPVTTDAAWRGDALMGQDSWIYRLTDAQVAELEELGRRFVEADPDLRFVQASDYPLVECAQAVKDWGRDVDYGRGFVLVRGLRTHLYSDALSAAIYYISGSIWAIPFARTRWATSSTMSMRPRTRPWTIPPPYRPKCATSWSIIPTVRTSWR